MTETIDESKIPEPPIGSHLISPRTAFNHHGLYAGNGKVIHYSGMARTLSGRDFLKLPHLIRYGSVVKTSMKRFCDGHGFRVVEHPHAKFRGEEAVLRAKKRLYERSYYLYGNNCEHFVNWCIDDTFKSPAVTRMLFLYAAAGAAVHLLGFSRVAKLFPKWLQELSNRIFAVSGSAILTHFTLDAMQPAAGMRGRERKNRRVGRIAAWAGFFLSALIAVFFGRRKKVSPVASALSYFLPVASGLGVYGVARLHDTAKRDALRRERRQKAAEAMVATEEAPRAS